VGFTFQKPEKREEVDMFFVCVLYYETQREKQFFVCVYLYSFFKEMLFINCENGFLLINIVSKKVTDRNSESHGTIKNNFEKNIFFLFLCPDKRIKIVL